MLQSHTAPWWTLYAIVLGVVYLSKCFFNSTKSNPPGPPGWPLIGNALQIPRTFQWETFSKWANTYGDVTYVEAMGQRIVILSSYEAIQDLFNKRSTIYSDRPHTTMAITLSGLDRMTSRLQYGDTLRQHRRIISLGLSKSLISSYYPLQESVAHELTLAIVANPDELFNQVAFRIGAIIFRVTYGYTPVSDSDPLLLAGIKSLEDFLSASEPGRWLVDSLPWLRHLPSWMPGTNFLHIAKQTKEFVEETTWGTYEHCRDSLQRGTALLPNVCHTYISQFGQDMPAKEEENLAWAAGTLLGGGLDTSMGIILPFFMLMVLHPEVQEKAQQELDMLLQGERLPTIHDQTSLPYVRSVISEVMRFWTVAPLSFPHSLAEDDVYRGYHLTKGMTFLANVWHVLHDPVNFPNPMIFDPDRYRLLDSEMDKIDEVFWGFGRRACPGRYLAEGTLFAIIATVLSTCNILPAVDSEGRMIKPELKAKPGLAMLPQPFRCQIKPRSQGAFELLSQAKM